MSSRPHVFGLLVLAVFSNVLADVTEPAAELPPEEWHEDECQGEGDEECALSLRQLRGRKIADLKVQEGSEKQVPWLPSCALYGCGAPYSRYAMCQCNHLCTHYGNCCGDYSSTCAHTVAPTTPFPPSPATTPSPPVPPNPLTTPSPTSPPSTSPPAPTPTPPPTPAPSLAPGHVVGEDPDCRTSIQSDPVCWIDLQWAINTGIHEHPDTYDGLTPSSPIEEFQYWFYRKGLGGCKMPCGIVPGPDDPHAVLTTPTRGIPPPTRPFQYNGMTWPSLQVRGHELMHFFAVGDWGGLAGLLPHNSQIIQYSGGDGRGPYTMGRYRVHPRTHELTCTTLEMADCFGTWGKLCTGEEDNNTKCCLESCGWNANVDVPAQLLVADQMKKRAKLSNPHFVLNVGDNFYWGGVYGKCGATPMSRISDITQTQFRWVYENIYHGPGLDGKPWFTCFGNHDWGGREFSSAWDQQIAYTWTSDRWILPAAYWMTRVEFVDQNFTADIFMIDSNIEDAFENTSAHPEHNICSEKYNQGSTCASVDGVPDIQGCHQWFSQLWKNGSEWVVEKMRNSDADWQILVTHFPCGHKSRFYKDLHLKYGLDLMVTGHIHFQMMYWDPARLGGLTCFITGGGGGITSENTVDMESGRDHQYGFYDLTISRDQIGIESINWNGTTIGQWTVHPKMGTDTVAARNAPCSYPNPGDACYRAVQWAMQDGIHGHPDWFPDVRPGGTFAEFQNHFYVRGKDGCPKPCLS